MVQRQFLAGPGRIFRGLGMIAVVFFALMSCGKGSRGNGGPSGGSHGATTLRGRAARLDNFLVNYGPWDAAKIAIAQHYDVVVVHPSQGVTRDIVRQIQQGVDPNNPADDVLVLGYISIGEDLR